MRRSIDTREAANTLEAVIDEVAKNGQDIILERAGTPVAALIPIRLYEELERRRDAFFEDIRATAARVNMSEDEAMALALREQQADRAERRR